MAAGSGPDQSTRELTGAADGFDGVLDMLSGALARVDSQLAALYLGQSVLAAAATSFTTTVQQFAGSVSQDGRYVVIDATAADGSGATLLAQLAALGLVGGASFGAMASGWLPVDQIALLSTLTDFKFAAESLVLSNAGTGLTVSQGVTAMNVTTANSLYGVDGTGLKVGILSDSFNALGGMSTDIANGDLPASTSVLQDLVGGTDEGRAMAQIVHDVAPGAAILFATAVGGQATFANNIIALKNAGAKVIVDDVGYFLEPMYQDGVIAQAVDQVVAAGVTYFSAAGNEGHKGYEAPFRSAASSSSFGKPEIWHDFGGGNILMPFTLGAGRTATVVLEWNQPAASVSPGHGATSDLDLFVTDNSGRVVSSSSNNNSGNDPITGVQFTNNSGTTQTYNIKVGLAGGTAPSDFKIVTFNGGGTVGNNFASNTNDGTIYGHAAATNAIAVGADYYAQTPAFGVNPPVVESFSSGGPTSIAFNTAGNPAAQLRQTLQFTAPDGGNTSFFGFDDNDADTFPNFFGTSAAAPHAAAVAALMLQANALLNPADIGNLLKDSAIDMDNPATAGFDTGFDNGTGAGLIQADRAVGFAKTLTISASSPGSTLWGTHLSDVFFGAGDNTVVFSAGLASYAPTNLGTRIAISGPEGNDTLVAVGHLRFADGTINLGDSAPDFDPVYYDRVNLDVFHAGASAIAHYNQSGWHEGRDPNPFFSTVGYLGANADVRAAGNNPLDQFHQTGWREDRDPGPDFDTRLYLIHNPDIAAAGVDPLQHYLQSGRAEGRPIYAAVGSTIVGGFDAEYYAFHNPDVARAGVDPLQHYLTVGWKEGRNPNAYFDDLGYLARYTDVAAAGVNPLLHYEQSGWHESRDPSASFDTIGYLALNPDVAAAHVNPLDHYLQSGIYEGRQILNDGVFH